MLKSAIAPYRFYLRSFLLAVVFFTISRIVFAIQNPATIPNTGNLLLIFLYGLHYDITALCWILLPFTLLWVYPTRYLASKSARYLLLFLLCIPVSFALLLNYADAGWFTFQHRRSTSDVFAVLGTGDDFIKNLPSYLLSYLHLTIVWLLSVLFFFRLSIKNTATIQVAFTTSVRKRILSALLFLMLFFIGIRGGVQLKPLSTQKAATLYGPETAPLILNTPYTIIKSTGDVALTDPQFFSPNKAAALYPLHHQMQSGRDSIRKNVVLIILESFSSEYFGKEFTPFLDSLSKHSIYFTHAYANGKRSIEGLPSILASVPAWMNEPFITSQYNTIRINSIASLLKKQGYKTSFFHGGKNGTMGFDNFTAAAGFEKYYGKSEYDGPKTDDDGNWGIYDHAFYQFMIRKLKTEKEPFTSAVFSLSSHHPYTVPADRKDKYPEGPLPILKSIAYADDALREFFREASQQKWFANTVFIITADHTGPTFTTDGSTATGIFHIPILIYSGGIKASIRQDVAQQIDILPTALNLAGYTGSYSSLGRDLTLEATDGSAINFTAGNWQYITRTSLLQWDGDSQPLCKSTTPNGNCELDFMRLKAGLQQYRNGLIGNRLVIQ